MSNQGGHKRRSSPEGPTCRRKFQCGASGGLAVLYGDGSGSFTPAGSYASLNDACDVAIGYLNGDNRLDVIVPAARARVVESYLNETP